MTTTVALPTTCEAHEVEAVVDTIADSVFAVVALYCTYCDEIYHAQES